MIEVKAITAQQTLPLRSAVLRPGAALREAIYMGDEDAKTLHFGAFHGREIVGVASLYREALPSSHEANTWRLRGMAVEPAMQRCGFGRLLLQTCVEQVGAHGGELLWCNARTTATGFYLSCGFQVHSEEFDIPGIGPHFVMQHRIRL